MRLRFPLLPYRFTPNQQQISAPSIQSITSFSTLKARPAPQLDKMRLVFDFDGTITQKDTISVLAQSAVNFQLRTHRNDFYGVWNLAVHSYMHQLRCAQDEYPIKAKDRRRLHEEIAYMEAMNPVELASLERVSNLGLFARMDDAVLYQLGVEARRSGEVVLRDGFMDLCRLARQRGWDLAIISVNWSRHFIGGVLSELGTNTLVVANHITPAGKIEGPVALGRPLINATGKLEVLRPLLRDQRCIYFGDSNTDLLCLVQHLGVAMFNIVERSALIDTLVRVGHGPQSVAVCSMMPILDGQTFSAQDFHEVIRSGLIEKATMRRT